MKKCDIKYSMQYDIHSPNINMYYLYVSAQNDHRVSSDTTLKQ